MTRQCCETCGCFLRGGTIVIGYGRDARAVEDDREERCHVCPLLAMTSQRVREHADAPADYDGMHADIREDWRGREDEANAWAFPLTYEECGSPPVSDNKITVFTMKMSSVTQGWIEERLASRRPRAVIEEGPIAYGLEMLDHAAEQLLEAFQNEDTPDGPYNASNVHTLRERIDARIGHTSRDVPAFSIHDRYREAAPDGIGMEPRAEYIIASFMMMADDQGVYREFTVQSVSGGGTITFKDYGP